MPTTRRTVPTACRSLLVGGACRLPLVGGACRLSLVGGACRLSLVGGACRLSFSVRLLVAKIHLIADWNGLSLSLGFSGATMDDGLGLKLLVRGIALVRSRRGSCCRRSARLRAAARDTAGITCGDGCARGASVTGSLAKGVESLGCLGCHRWVVEGTVSWLAGCRCLYRRYERKAERFLAFVGMVAALFGCRRLSS
ncbi:hypothetical protein ACFQ9Z_37470 [Streptomyces sp. NPDC056580]|uniref:hypothetical protein n=1 Tax=Streptomyces sp. NPDC056580 TaxID=3345872 RepID=UPI003693A589